MKGLKSVLLIPALLILALLTLATYLVFSMTVERYMQEESRREIRGLVLAVSPFADRVFRVPDDLDTITPSQLALRWLFTRGMDLFAAFSSGSPDRIRENWRALDLELPQAEADRLCSE